MNKDSGINGESARNTRLSAEIAKELGASPGDDKHGYDKDNAHDNYGDKVGEELGDRYNHLRPGFGKPNSQCCHLVE